MKAVVTDDAMTRSVMCVSPPNLFNYLYAEVLLINANNYQSATKKCRLDKANLVNVINIIVATHTFGIELFIAVTFAFSIRVSYSAYSQCV